MIRSFAVLPAVLLLTSCAGGGGLGQIGEILGQMGGMGGGAQGGQIRAEIDQVDSRSQRIHVRAQNGQSGSLLYDQQTQVIYQQQQYPVTALERGDLVVIEAQQTSGNELYAQRVLVEQSVQERTGGTTGSAQLRQLDGQVGQIDHQRGMFELRTQYGGVLVVSLPYNPARATEDRFARLRSGDSVRIEGEVLSDGRVQLVRFL